MLDWVRTAALVPYLLEKATLAMYEVQGLASVHTHHLKFSSTLLGWC